MGIFVKPASWPITPLWIETGVGYGDSVEAALQIGYPQVVSIEWDEGLFEKARFRFIGRRARFYHGSSPDALGVILDFRTHVTFWLDAHCSGGGPWGQFDERYGECPLLDELAAIVSVPWKTLPFIAIDDASMFSGDVPRGFRASHWPRLAELQSALFGWHVDRVGDVLQCTPR